MAWIERQRCEDRADLTREIAAEVLADRTCPLIRFQKRDPLGGQLLAQLFPDGGLCLEQSPSAAAHRVELLLGVVSVRRDVFDPLVELLQRRRNPNHVELVEIATGNAEELDALQQWMGGISSLVEDPLVERKPAQLAVDIERGIFQVSRIDVARWNDVQRRSCVSLLTPSRTLSAGGNGCFCGFHVWPKAPDPSRAV